MQSPPEAPEPREPSTDASVLADAWRGLEGDLDRERGVAGSLRRLPTTARFAIALVLALVPAAVVLAFAPRADLHTTSIARALAWLATLAPLAALGAHVAVRPLHARALEPRQLAVLAAAAAIAAGVLVLLPLGDPAMDVETHGPLQCVGISLGVGASVYLVARVLRRDAIGAGVGAGTLAACAAFVAAILACPIDALFHLAPGHAAPMAVMALAALVWERRALRRVPA